LRIQNKMYICSSIIHTLTKSNDMTTEEILINIQRLEDTIQMNIWNKGYVENCKSQIESYKLMLNATK
jgi:hypothetical protein